MVGAIVILPTDSASQEPVVDLAQRVVSSTSALNIRIVSSRGALGRSCCSRVYFRKLHHTLRMRRSISIDVSALWLTLPPRYTNSFLRLNTWPAAPTLNMAVDSGILFARNHYLGLGLRYGEAKRRTHGYDYPHRLPQLLGRLRDDPGIVSLKHALKRHRQD